MLQVLHQPGQLIWLKGGEDVSILFNNSVPHESRALDDVKSEENPIVGWVRCSPEVPSYPNNSVIR